MNSSVFLPCEFKPNTFYFKKIENFCSLYRPAFIFADLFEISCNPYSDYIIDNVGYVDTRPILFGYLCDFNADGLMFLDKIKGFTGNQEWNTNFRRLSHCFFDFSSANSCWTYQFRRKDQDFSNLKKINFGLWDMKDLELISFAEKIVGNIEE